MLIETAERLDCPTFVYGQDFLAYEENGRMVYQDEDGLMDLPPPRLPGRHQFANAAAAIAAVKAAGFEISHARRREGDEPASTGRAACSGCRRAGWRNWRRRAPRSGSTAATIPAPAWSSPKRWPSRRKRIPRPLFLICGMINTKDQTGYFRAFKGMARHVYTVPVSLSDAGVPNDELAIRATEAGPVGRAGQLRRQRADAAARHLGRRETPPRILIGGSLYLAGAVLAENGTPPT